MHQANDRMMNMLMNLGLKDSRMEVWGWGRQTGRIYRTAWI
ncbi:Uncharacterised protein [Actinobacillus pleuropneumoniae]|nr:Uncharacterised protein [Actinobacillus pleuropneumoniae]